MMEKSNDENQIPEFMQIIAGYTDDELRKVLKKRKLYRKEAADFAIQEAIKRGLIYSEQDLFAKEYNDEPEKFSIFPTIENEKARAKFKKSISRSLLILGVLPMVWGGFKIYETQSWEGILIFVFGASLSLTSFQIMRSAKLNPKLIYFLFLLAFLAFGYLIKEFISSHYINTIDLLISAIAVGFVFYAIGFLGKMKQ